MRAPALRRLRRQLAFLILIYFFAGAASQKLIPGVDEIIPLFGWSLFSKVPNVESRYTLLVQSRAGYQNLCRLITRMKLRAGTKNPKPGREPAATPEDFTEFSEGLLCLTGGDEGPLARGLRDNNARETLERIVHIFGRENVCVEL